jgi:Zn-dependent peptidase ImmA (M78 family)
MSSASDLYATLKPLGIKPAQMRALLPDWWDDAYASSVDGGWEHLLLVARILSLDAGALSRGDLKPTGAVTSLAYKHSKTTAVSKLAPSSLLASSLAQAVVSATERPFAPPPRDTSRIHAEIKRLGQGKADFDGLLAFCWSSGIPVLPLPNLPAGMKRMDGAALKVGDRPAIVISRRNDSKSWLSFILAHELGHIALGHLTRDSAIVDVALQKETTFESTTTGDQQESEANDFSLAVLGGVHADETQLRWGDRLAPVQLAAAAREAASRLAIGAGHLVLRYAFRTKRWSDALTALRFLSEDFDAQELVANTLAKNVNADVLADDLRGLVTKITGAGLD